MRDYKIREGVVIEFRDGVEFRAVSPGHQGYAAWLDAGNAPEELPPLPGPPVPTLAEAKASLKTRVDQAVSKYFSAGLYPNVKAWAVSVEVPPFGPQDMENLRNNLLELRVIGGETMAAIDACTTHEELAALTAQLEAEYAGYIS